MCYNQYISQCHVEEINMFNQEQKQEYINQQEEYNTTALTNYFKRLSKAEAYHNKDLADMNYEEIKSTLTSLNIRGVESRGHLVTLMKKYISWTITNGKTQNTINHINNIRPEDISSRKAMQTQMIRDPEQIRHILNTVYNPDYYRLPNRACRDRLILWLLYCGVSVDEMPLLRKTDINVANKKVNLPENKFAEINDEVINLWEQHTEHTCIEKRGAYNEKDIYYYEMVDNEYLFRILAGMKTNNNKLISKSMIVSTVVKIFKEYNKMTSLDILVSPISMKISGIFYKLHLEERTGTEITPEVLNRYFNVDYSSPYDLSVKMRKWRIDYEDWKLAFGFDI